jgi:hypothetical protein
MSEKFYICRGAIGNWSYQTNNYGWGKHFKDAKAFINRDAAITVLNGRPGSVWSESELKASPYYQEEMKTTSSKSQAVEVLKPSKLARAANLKSGDDAAAAKQLNKLFTEAQNGMRRVVALGLFAWEIKEGQLKHGEFGAWLAEHCPKLATLDSVTGRAKPSRALSGYMELTKNVLESCGCPTIEKYLATVAKFADDANLKPGQFLLIADKKVPETLAPMREKIFSLVDGKTQRALFMEFKQTDDDEKPKRGRLKGQGGATKEQRANAAELEAQERITEKKLRAEEISNWLIEMSDDAGLGEIAGTLELDVLDRAMEQARGYIKHHGGKS